MPGIGEVTAPAPGLTTTMVVPVTLDHPSTDTVEVRWSTLAVPDAPDIPEPQAPASDHDAVSGTVTFPAGSTSASVSFDVTGNAAHRFEYVVVSFSSPTHAAMGGY